MKTVDLGKQANRTNEMEQENLRKNAKIMFNNRKLNAKMNLKRSVQVKELQKYLHENEFKHSFLPNNREEL